MTDPTGRIIKGDSLEVLGTLPAESVQLVLTSPPYWGLRDYQADGQSLEGQWGREPTPEAHVERMVEWAQAVRRVLRKDGVLVINYGEAYAGGGGYCPTAPSSSESKSGKYGATGALVKGQRAPAGLKPKDLLGMPWRIAQALQADGWWWRAWWPWVKLNGMPESCRDRPALSCEVMLMFTKSARYFWDQEAVRVGYAPATLADQRTADEGERKDRQFPGAPSRGATNLSRRAAVFARPVKEGVRPGQSANQHRPDREPTEYAGHGRIRKTGDWHRESVALAIEQARAWADHAEAVLARKDGTLGALLDFDGLPLGQLHPTFAYPGSHFATYPPALVRPIIRAATSERGACPACGGPWVREVEVGYSHDSSHANGSFPGDVVRGEAAAANGGRRGVQNMRLGRARRDSNTRGWRPSCECRGPRPKSLAGENMPAPGEVGTGPLPPVPCVVLDPFAGTGTTCVVAAEEGRSSIGIDLYGGEYDFGGHTAMDRLRQALGEGPPIETLQAERAGQTALFTAESAERAEG